MFYFPSNVVPAHLICAQVPSLSLNISSKTAIHIRAWARQNPRTAPLSMAFLGPGHGKHTVNTKDERRRGILNSGGGKLSAASHLNTRIVRRDCKYDGEGFSWQQSVIVFHSAQSGTLIGIHGGRTNLRTGLNLKRSSVMAKCSV